MLTCFTLTPRFPASGQGPVGSTNGETKTCSPPGYALQCMEPFSQPLWPQPCKSSSFLLHSHPLCLHGSTSKIFPGPALCLSSLAPPWSCPPLSPIWRAMQPLLSPCSLSHTVRGALGHQHQATPLLPRAFLWFQSLRKGQSCHRGPQGPTRSTPCLSLPPSLSLSHCGHSKLWPLHSLIPSLAPAPLDFVWLLVLITQVSAQVSPQRGLP